VFLEDTNSYIITTLDAKSKSTIIAEELHITNNKNINTGVDNANGLKVEENKKADTKNYSFISSI
jgi:hypothetical protein